MEQREFGNTGWRVSTLSLGTVELGREAYGLYEGDESRRGPSEKEARAILLRAFENGVNLVDTAPGYGRSEALIGEALRQWREPIYVATKVSVCIPEGRTAKDFIMESLEESLRRLGRERLDLVQLHNPTIRDLSEGDVLEVLLEARDQGKIDVVGASVYGVPNALEALDNEAIAVVQIGYSVLDQRAAEEVFPLASRRGKALLGRSALLKGALTGRRRQLPPSLAQLERAADRVERWARKAGTELTKGALRFCFSQEALGSTLVGVRDVEELDTALAAASEGRLPLHKVSDAFPLAVTEESLIDPRRWGIP